MVARTEKINEKVAQFLDILKNNIKIHSAYIYGSYSKGNVTSWSDIDVAIVSPDFSENTFEERVELMKIAATIDDRIEPYPFRVEDFEEDNPLVDEIKKYGIQVS